MLSSGVTSMGARSYIPQLGRFLQTDPIAGGSANAYAYTNGDPVNETDLTGMYTITLSATLIAAENKNSEEEAARGIALAATESTARAEAQRKAAEAAAQAAAYAAIKQNEWMYGTTGSEESGPEEEYWEEEGKEEYAAFRSGSKTTSHARSSQHTQSAEGGVSFQSLEESADFVSQLSLCAPGSSGSCTRQVASPCAGKGNDCRRHHSKPKGKTKPKGKEKGK